MIWTVQDNIRYTNSVLKWGEKSTLKPQRITSKSTLNTITNSESLQAKALTLPFKLTLVTVLVVMEAFFDEINYTNKTWEKRWPRPTWSWAFLFASRVSKCWCSQRLLGTRLNRCTNSEGKQESSFKYLSTQTSEIHLLEVHMGIKLDTYDMRM